VLKITRISVLLRAVTRKTKTVSQILTGFLLVLCDEGRTDKHESTQKQLLVNYGILWLQLLSYTERTVTVVTPPSCIIQYYMQQHIPLRVIWIRQHSTVLCPSEMFRRNLTVCKLHVIPSGNENTVQPHKCSRGN